MPLLEKLLARNLACSRKDARRMLDRAREDLPRELDASELPTQITIRGQDVVLHDSFHLVLNKPAGCVTALSDPTHETAARYIQDAPLFSELRPAGRLDLDTTGLLLWTTDGTWLHRLTHPRAALPRTYHAALARPFQTPQPDLVLRDGHRPDIRGVRLLDTGEVHPSLIKPAGVNIFASITIVGGAYHEVRRIFAALGSHVSSLCRVAFGDLDLPRDLPPGQWRQVANESREGER